MAMMLSGMLNKLARESERERREERDSALWLATRNANKGDLGNVDMRGVPAAWKTRTVAPTPIMRNKRS